MSPLVVVKVPKLGIDRPLMVIVYLAIDCSIVYDICFLVCEYPFS